MPFYLTLILLFPNHFFLDNNTITLFDIYYNLSDSSWALITGLKPSFLHTLSSSFESPTLTISEIVRLNPKAANLEFIKKQLHEDKENILFLQNNFTIFTNDSVSIMRY